MQKFIRTFIPAALLGPYLYFLNTALMLGGNSIPPVGGFLNPFDGFWQNAEDRDLTKEINMTYSGLSSPTEIWYDDRLVPHIFTGESKDLHFATGFTHARHRLWQMDIVSRQASGRLAEILGERLLANDIRMRKMGMGWTAQKFVAEWKKCPDYEDLRAYTAGVNAYVNSLERKDWPLEFKLLNYKPEPWSVLKTALVMMSMNLSLCGRNEDIANTNTQKLLGEAQYEYLFPEWNPLQSPIIPKSVKWPFNDVEIEETPQPLDKVIGSHHVNDAPPHIGSNNWAVGPSMTRDGATILCNDPHLSLSLPSVWYELHLASADMNTYGVSFPGIPNVIIGFNEHIAWGQTNVGHDVSDLYAIQWSDEKKEQYIIDGKTYDAIPSIEQYLIKGGETVTDTIFFTHWGPILHNDSIDLALKWLPHVALETCINQTFSSLNKSRGYDDYIESLKSFTTPPQNFAFACTTGDIAIKVQGSFPIKRPGQGKMILDGAKSSNDWLGRIPFDRTPMVKNPDRGFISSANQHSTDTTYPYYYYGYFEDYRSRTLNQKLAERSNWTVEDMKHLQNDNYSQLAADFCPILLDLIADAEISSTWQAKIKQWNFHYDKDRVEPIFFDDWYQRYYRLTWDEFYRTSKDLQVSTPEIWRTIELSHLNPEDSVFDIKDTEITEDAGVLALMAFEKSVQYCDSLLALDPSYDYGKHRPVTINHLTRIPAFSVSDIEVGSTARALNAMRGTHGPSWRMIVKLSNPKVEAWGIYPGGQSGNPGSPFYKHTIEDWAVGNYYPLRFVKDRGSLKSHLTQKIVFNND